MSMKAALTGRFFLSARLCLANAHKMRYHNYMDLQCLLWLQDIRMGRGQFIENLLCFISDTPIYFIVVLALLYSILDKKKFSNALFCYIICSTLNAFVKITACVYRPWIKEPRIVPAKKSLGSATGYSFPSGHTSCAASCSLGVVSQYKDNKVLVILLAIYTLIVAFSRCYLSCHTPQDVLVGLVEAAVALAAASALAKFIQKKEGNDKVVFVGATILFAALFAYIFIKPYPIDLDAAANVLVDPKKMQQDAVFDFAFAIGFIHAWFLERRFIKFSTDKLDAKKRAVRLLVVSALALIISLALYPAAKALFDKRLAKFIDGYLLPFSSVFIGPMIFSKIERALKW